MTSLQAQVDTLYARYMTDEPADSRQQAEARAAEVLAELDATLRAGGDTRRGAFQRADVAEDSIEDAWMQAALAFIAGNFSSAFLQALGRHAGNSVANLPRKASDLVRKRLRRRGQPDEYRITAEGDATATIVVTEDTPDRARLALLDVDVTAPELRGKLLRWDTAAGEWRPSDDLAADQGQRVSGQ